MSSLTMTIREALRYRGMWGHWSWLAHRLSGLAIIFYLIIHVWDTANATFAPEVYRYMLEIFKLPPFGLGEIMLMAAVLYHAFNGIRITLLDFKPEWWQYQRQSAIAVWVLFFITFTPLAIFMLASIIRHCTGDHFLPGESCWTWPTYPVPAD